MFIVIVAIICGVFRENSNTIFYFMHKEISGDFDLVILPRTHLGFDKSLIKRSKEVAQSLRNDQSYDSSHKLQ